ncbi:hypothetical protein ABVF61_02335 [Roseibium sp. HPY-6]|uniref:hypothetical protein n=1 Tax=Roseibium sp. HPY-6 TaxID=3229852 RepID=UPI00338F1F0C
MILRTIILFLLLAVKAYADHPTSEAEALKLAVQLYASIEKAEARIDQSEETSHDKAEFIQLSSQIHESIAAYQSALAIDLNLRSEKSSSEQSYLEGYYSCVVLATTVAQHTFELGVNGQSQVKLPALNDAPRCPCRSRLGLATSRQGCRF